MTSHPHPPPPAEAVLSGLTLYFPHVDRGQSVLVRLPANGWIVVDANHPPGGKPNATCELLREPAEEDDFKIIALVVTHFHEDHYSGIVDVLGLCREVAQRCGCELRDVVEVLILPLAYDLFYRFVAERAGRVGGAHLKAFLANLEELRRQNVEIGTLPPYQFSWRSQGRTQPAGALQTEESWAFTFYPEPHQVNRIFLEERAPDEDLPSPDALGDVLRQAANRYAYVLGIGHGPDSTDLHVLLTSDIPGEEFTRLTANLREKVVPAAARGHFGAPILVNLLLRHLRGTPQERLRPVQCLTVPHHGSGTDPARAEDLDWWLDDERGPSGSPAFAMVQGGPYALRKNTLDELFKARLEVFATVKPLRVEDLPYGHTGCKDLDERILASVESDRRSYVSSVDSMKDDPDLPPAHLRVHGGTGGIHRVFAENLYKIVPDPLRIEHLPFQPVHEAAGTGPS